MGLRARAVAGTDAAWRQPMLFDAPEFDAHEHVSFFADGPLRAIIAVHRTGPLGTAGGGCRIWPYPDERAALRDALRLSRAMTYKLALVELSAGGAKAVVIADPNRDKSEALLTAVGRAVDRLAGRFIVAADVGTDAADLATIARATMWVSREPAGADDGAEATAYGVFVGLVASVRWRLDRADLSGVKVAVQGLGRVGAALCRRLAAAGAQLWITDLDEARRARLARELHAVAVPPSQILTLDVDVLAPCALADTIDAAALPELRCRVVAGSANNQLADPALADELSRRGILWAPDIAINAGGAIGAASSVSLDEASGAPLRARLDTLGTLLTGIFERAAREHVSTLAAAERTARERFAAMGGRL
jgi:leucine dehydrogenase